MVGESAEWWTLTLESSLWVTIVSQSLTPSKITWSSSLIFQCCLHLLVSNNWCACFWLVSGAWTAKQNKSPNTVQEGNTESAWAIWHWFCYTKVGEIVLNKEICYSLDYLSMQNRNEMGTIDRSVQVREGTGSSPDDISESLASLFAN